MPFLPTAGVVNAVVESTSRYFAFLRANKVGVSRHLARGICLDDSDLFFDNSRWQSYRCSLHSHLSIRSNSSATLIPHAAPGDAIEIRIRDYDRRTGVTTFATQQPIPGEAGNIVIDFRWLVQRCLDWFRQRGLSIPEFAEFQTPALEAANPLVQTEGLSEEKLEAIRIILTTKLSYVWGPPGTGKTQWVLAKAARHCVDQGQKVLVLASTNHAVDNALRSVLNEGIDKLKVARIGIPSERFIKDYPECCEARAFQHEILQTRAQITALQDSIATLEKAQRLIGQIEEKTAGLENQRRNIVKDRATLASVEDERRQNWIVLIQRQEAFKAADDCLNSTRCKLEELSFQQLVFDIDTLESEQTRCIKNAETLEEELSKLGFLARLFTGRKRELKDSLSKESGHLRSVEDTLQSKRKKRDELAPVVSKLESEIAGLEFSRRVASNSLTEQQGRNSELETRGSELQTVISRLQDDARRLEEEITCAKEELSAIGERQHTEQANDLLAAWRAEIQQHEDQIAKFRQDLSSKPVLGMTLDGFIGLTLEDTITVDRVFIDEAPYAPLAKLLPVLSLGCPIAMLGDHLQLPPVCPVKNDPVIRAYWAKPAIFLEDAFRFGRQWNDLHQLKEPEFELTQRRILTNSYRFGQTLASLLDRHIYGEIGLTGLNPSDTAIRCIHCEPRERNGRKPRENDAEADAIVERLDKWWIWAQTQLPQPMLAILTPYKNQAKLIRDRIRGRFGNSLIRDHLEVWNTHQAQGREWDWVLFSVSDTRNLVGNDPYYSDSRNADGKPLINTTISRAKRHLVIFLDETCWNRETGSLLAELASLGGE